MESLFEQLGGTYTRQGDYCLPDVRLPPEEKRSIGIYGQRAEAMFSRLVKQLSEKEGVTEALKSENQMLWVQRMNNIRSAAMEIVTNDLICC